MGNSLHGLTYIDSYKMTEDINSLVGKPSQRLTYVDSYKITNGPKVELTAGDIIHTSTDAIIVTAYSTLQRHGLFGHIYLRGKKKLHTFLVGAA